MTTQLRIGGLPILRFLKNFSKNQELAKRSYNDYMNYFESCNKHYGYETAVKILKEINSRSRHYAAGYPRGNHEIAGVWSKTLKKASNLPKKLGSLQRFLDEEPNMALLIPNHVYTLRVPPSNDITTLEEEEKSSISDDDKVLFERYCKIGCPKLKLANVKHYFTCKGGPNGPSAISHAQDLVALQLSTFSKPFTEYIKIFHGENSWLEKIFSDFSKDVIQTENLIKFKEQYKQPLNAKLVFLSSPAGKTRIVYVANWWVQACLLPLHEALMNCFYYIGNDATWDQNLGVRTIKSWSSQKRKLYSFDLSAATDRWPLWHQSIVLENCFNKDAALAWGNLCRIAPFDETRDKHVFYKVGQPMGLLSSWAALNMSHHMVLRYLSWRYKTRRDYIVLGDDIVIADCNLARHYKRYMNDLGVKINESKSISCEEGKPFSAEFARNIVRDGRSIGCVSPNILYELIAGNNYSITFEFLKEIKEKYEISIFINKEGALIPKRLYNFLSKKCLKECLYTLCCNQEEFELPVTYLKEGESPPEDNYVVLENPWSEVDKPSIAASIKQKWMRMNQERTNKLMELLDGLDSPESLTIKGYLLELKSHPLRYVLLSINDEIMESLWTVMRGKRLTPTQITTSIDLLINVLTKGVTYRQWRTRQVDRHKNLMKFFSSLHKQYARTRKEIESSPSYYKQTPYEEAKASDWEKELYEAMYGSGS
jgi:hypothetical protein